MKKIEEMKMYLLVLAVAFYVLPLFRNGDDMFNIVMINYITIPAITFAMSYMYGKNKNSNILFPIMVVLIFIPTIFIYYSWSLWFYVVIYLLIAFSGNMIGIEKRKKTK